jgi:hypothetical protein
MIQKIIGKDPVCVQAGQGSREGEEDAGLA